MLLAIVFAMQQVVVTDVSNSNASRAYADTAGPFWPRSTHTPVYAASAHFMQLGSVSVPERIAYNPCVPRDLSARLDRAERALTDSARANPQLAESWLKLACVRILANNPMDGLLSHPDLLLRGGLTPSVSALLRVNAMLPADTIALVLLARQTLRAAPGRLSLGYVPAPLPLDAVDITSRDDGWAPVPSLASAAAAMQRATNTGNTASEVRRACTSLMIDIGDYTAAHDCSIRALIAGSDTTWHALRLSWLAYMHGDALEGERWFDRSIGAAHSVAARVELGWHFEPDHDWRDTYTVGLGASTHSITADSMPAVRVTALREEKTRWLTLPDKDFSAWILRARSNRKIDEPWVGLDRDRLKKHFESITYNGSSFRDCIASDSMPPCDHAVATARFDAVPLAARRYQLWDPVHSTPMTLLVFSVPRDALSVSTSNDQSVAAMNAHLIQTSPSTGVQQDTAFTVQLAGERTATELTGFLLTAAPRSFSSWSLAIQQPRSRMRGGAFQDDQGAISSGSLAISDIIVGEASQRAITWRIGESEHAAQLSTNSLNRKVAMHLYFQVRSRDAQRALTTTVAVYRDGATSPALQVKSTAQVPGGVTETERELDISRLNAGIYRIEVRVADATGGVDARSVRVRFR
jgi:hypothetical protein